MFISLRLRLIALLTAVLCSCLPARAAASQSFEMAIVASDAEVVLADDRKLTLKAGSLVSVIESSQARSLVLAEQFQLLDSNEGCDEIVGGWVSSERLTSLDSAFRSASQSLASNADDLVALWTRANANVALQQLDKAITDLSQAITIDGEKSPVLLLRHADVCCRLGRYADSISNCNRALVAAPNLLSAYLIRARCHCGSGRFDDAVADCNKALLINQKAFAAFCLLSYVHLLSDDVPKALAGFSEGIRSQGRLPLIAKRVNMLLVPNWDSSRGQFNEVRELQSFQRACRQFSVLTEMMLLYGVREEQREEYEISQLYLTALLLVPLSPRTEMRAYYYRSRAYAAVRWHESAQKDISEALRVATDSPEASSVILDRRSLHANEAHEFGAELADAQNYEMALAKFDEALRLDPELIVATIDQAFTWLRMGDFENALTAFDKAIATSTMGPRRRGTVLRGRASALNNVGRATEAIEDLTRAVQIRPQFIDAWGSRAIIYARKGEFEKAMDDCRECVTLAPAFSLSYRFRASVYLLMGKLDRAIQDYTRAVDLGLRDADTFARRGYVHWKAGEYGSAIDDFERALRLDRNCALAHLCLAELRASCERAEFRDGAEALKHSQKAVELTKQHEDWVFETLAMAYSETGDFDKAFEYLQKAVDASPKTNITMRAKLKVSLTNRMPYRFHPNGTEPIAKDEIIPFELP